jgi:hypothetical protein
MSSGGAKKLAPVVERSSSFARSFYAQQAAAPAPALSLAPAVSRTIPAPRSRPMERQKSMEKRQSSRRGLGNTTAASPAPASMHVASEAAARIPENEVYDEIENELNSTGTGRNNPNVARGRGFPKKGARDFEEKTEETAHEEDAAQEGRGSWYVEALQQGNQADLDKIKNAPNRRNSNNDNQSSNFVAFDDEEVLEQYCIMAQHEASLRVKENTGFDIREYEKRFKLQGKEPTDRRGLYGGGKKPKNRLPEPKKFASSSVKPKPEEPPLPTPKLNIKFLEQTQARIPELWPGITVRGGSHVPNDEHIVRCLGCRGQVRVKILATLVSCPDCNTVSPASSTRR